MWETSMCETGGETTCLVNLGKGLDLGPVQHAQGQVNHLQVLAAGDCANGARLGADVEDDALLQPGDEEVGALVDDVVLDALPPVKDDGARAAADVVDGRAGQADGDGAGKGEPVEEVEGLGHGERSLPGGRGSLAGFAVWTEGVCSGGSAGGRFGGWCRGVLFVEEGPCRWWWCHGRLLLRKLPG